MTLQLVPEAGTVVRLLVAALAGLVVGFERERDGHEAGIRTFASVALGSALFGAISTTGFDEFVARRDTTNLQVDVTRVASQVVVGIGFLGAGLIFRQRGTVQNLTTAASLWAIAAVGLAAGVGQVGLAAAAAVLLLALLEGLRRPLHAAVDLGRTHKRRVRCHLAAGHEPDAVRLLVAAEDEVDVDVRRVEKEDGRPVVVLDLRCSEPSALDRLVETLVRAEAIEVLRVDE